MSSQINKIQFDIKHPLIRTAIAGFAIIVFYIFYTNWLIPQKTFLRDYSLFLSIIAKKIIELFGYKVLIFQNPATTSTYFFVDKNINVEVSYPCSGVNVSILYGIIIFMFRGDFLKKVLYTLFGYFLITIANIFRIATLAINLIINPQTLDFNHKYTFNIIVYSIIFGLWWYWLYKIQPKYLDNQISKKSELAS